MSEPSEVAVLNTIVWATIRSEKAARELPYAKALLPEDAMLIAVHIAQEPRLQNTDEDAAHAPDPSDPVPDLRRL